MALFLAVFYLILTFFRPQNLFSFLWGLQLTDVVGYAAIALMLFACLDQSVKRLLKQPQVILCMMCAGSVLLGYVVQTFLGRFIASIPLLILVFLPFLLAAYAATSRRAITIMLWTVTLSLIPMGISGWQQYFTGVGIGGVRPLVEYDGVIRVQGWGIFEGPNEMSTMMILGGVLAVGFVFRYWRRKFILAIAAAALVPLFAGAFWFTNSRQSVVFAAAGIYGLFAKLKTGRQLITFMLVGICLYGLISVSARWAGGVGDRASRRRGQAITQGIRVWKQHPVFGVGKGRARDYLGLKMPAHNSYVEVLVDTGMVGFAPYIGVGAVSIIQLLLLTRLVPETKEEKADLGLARQLLAGCMVVAVSAFFQNRAYSLDYFIIFGLCSGYGYYMCQKYKDLIPGPFWLDWHKKWGIVWLPVLGVIGLFGLHFAAKFYWAMV